MTRRQDRLSKDRWFWFGLGRGLSWLGFLSSQKVERGEVRRHETRREQSRRGEARRGERRDPLTSILLLACPLRSTKQPTDPKPDGLNAAILISYVLAGSLVLNRPGGATGQKRCPAALLYAATYICSTANLFACFSLFAGACVRLAEPAFALRLIDLI